MLTLKKQNTIKQDVLKELEKFAKLNNIVVDDFLEKDGSIDVYKLIGNKNLTL